MAAFPDLQLFMDDLAADGDQAVYRWTLVGRTRGRGEPVAEFASAASKSGRWVPTASLPNRSVTSTKRTTSASSTAASRPLRMRVTAVATESARRIRCEIPNARIACGKPEQDARLRSSRGRKPHACSLAEVAASDRRPRRRHVTFDQVRGAAPPLLGTAEQPRTRPRRTPGSAQGDAASRHLRRRQPRTRCRSSGTTRARQRTSILWVRGEHRWRRGVEQRTKPVCPGFSHGI